MADRRDIASSAIGAMISRNLLSPAGAGSYSVLVGARPSERLLIDLISLS
jgi:hypothetical protein